MLQQIYQIPAAGLDRVGKVGVGRLAVAADHGGAVHILLAQIAVGVAGHYNGHIRTHQLAYFLQNVMVAGADVLHLAGTVQMQEHAVQRAEVCADIVQQAVLDVIKGVAGDHTARKAIGIDRGYHFDAGIREHGAHVHLRNGVLAKPQVIIFPISFVGDVGVGLGHKLRHQNFSAHSRSSLSKEA